MLQDQFAESTNPALQGRVQMAAAKAAQDISSEPTQTPNHPMRVSLASQVARSPQMYTHSFTSMLCAQGITNDSTDAEISSMVAAVWDAIAGQPTPPLTMAV
ncbi:MAG TPA: hypothetical protein VJ649_04765 [Actinomycetes bacterium]|nr:hypothetical protein [Actinomycetes bacterium]